MNRKSFLTLMFAPLLAPFAKRGPMTPLQCGLPAITPPIGKLYYLDVIYTPMMGCKEIVNILVVKKDENGVPQVISEPLARGEEIVRQSWHNVEE